MITLNLDQWESRYQPEQNHLEPNAGFEGRWFETFGPELDYVYAVDSTSPGRVWTIMEGDDDSAAIVSGLWRVNALGYLVTTVACTLEDEIEIDFY